MFWWWWGYWCCVLVVFIMSNIIIVLGDCHDCYLGRKFSKLVLLLPSINTQCNFYRFSNLIIASKFWMQQFRKFEFISRIFLKYIQLQQLQLHCRLGRNRDWTLRQVGNKYKNWWLVSKCWLDQLAKDGKQCLEPCQDTKYKCKIQ